MLKNWAVRYVLKEFSNSQNVPMQQQMFPKLKKAPAKELFIKNIENDYPKYAFNAPL